MQTQVLSEPMRYILHKLALFGQFDILVFSDRLILDVDVHEWPPCDALLAYNSGKYPLSKVIEYSDMHSPVMVNSLRTEVCIVCAWVCLRCLCD